MNGKHRLSQLWLIVALCGASQVQAHGRVVEPPSRVVLCSQGENRDCPIPAWKTNAMESGKFFPARDGGLSDPVASTDAPNGTPPRDGEIASTSVNGAEKVLDEQSAQRWRKTVMHAGEHQRFVWEYSALHKTRRWNYFITRQDWNPNAPLTRAQFEAKPFCQYQNSQQPYWDHPELMPTSPTVHTCKLPKRDGYHVILAVWEVADTPHAFYQQIDAEFVNGGAALTSPFAPPTKRE
ncbi:lytic polysaccharide monooxygenase [Chitinasiproducens palmae]|uniref:Chitin-binding protein n=1 Tax=Chitinasiproducens palmae TaxID=1770053 RepID=A0A1H2PIY6_9BURK|nr:lytic polysaccharide monooxygenase [Chitinasiproducens palmae]SDV46255.1 chitin-binding protein [Chitinasiproducens palmae]